MHIQVLLLLFFMSSLPVSEAQSDVRESEVLRGIVFMRTEGLGMIELFYKHSRNKPVRDICLRIKAYYEQTQPAMLELCKGKNLQLSERELHVILEYLEKNFETYSSEKEQEYLQLCEEHINKSIQVYTSLVQDRKWESVSYFSFQALPELFNLKQELRKIRKL